MLLKGIVRRNGRWHVRKTIQGVRIEQSTKYPARREYHELANAILIKLESDALYGKLGVSKKVTLEEAAVRYMGECQAKDANRDFLALDKFVNMWGPLPLTEIRHKLVFDWIDKEQKRGRWASGINRELSVLKKLMTLASKVWDDEYGNRWLQETPKLPTASGPKKQGYALSFDEQRRLLTLFGEEEQRAILFLIHTGMRPGEAKLLEWSFLKEKDGIQFFGLPETKNGHPRPVVLSTSAKALLSHWRGLERPFPGLDRYRFRRLWKRAGLPTEGYRLGPHNCRNTCAQRMSDAGVSEEVRKEVLGHKNGDVSRVYAIPSLKRQLEALEAPYQQVMEAANAQS